MTGCLDSGRVRRPHKASLSRTGGRSQGRRSRREARTLDGGPERWLSRLRRVALGSARRSLGPELPQFFANGLAQDLFQMRTTNVVSQRLVHERLVVATARLFNLVAEVIEHLVVDPDCDSSLPRFHRKHRTSPAFAEIVMPLHIVHRSYSLHSLLLARRAEMR